MNEKEFEKAYRAKQESIVASTALKNRVIAQKVSDQISVKKRSKKPWFFAAAACVLAIALGFGLVPLMSNNGSSTPTAPTDFIVKAYAAEENSTMELTTDGQIVFGRDFAAGYQASDYTNAGFFTGCLLSIEGEGIERVQATISSGELYRFTCEEFVRSSDPARWDEALTWKASKRGSGTYYSGYDYVSPAETDAGESRLDPDKLVQVHLSKRLGSTVDIPYEDNCYLGFWTNEPLGETENPQDALIDLFDGQTLTVTVQFKDGHFSTQTIVLHSADMRFEFAYGADNGQYMKVLPEFVDKESLSPEEAAQTLSVHTLYGTITDTNDQPHPYPLDNANDREFIVDDPYIIPPREN